MRLTTPHPTPHTILVALVLCVGSVLWGTPALAAAPVAAGQTPPALQRAIVEGLAAGRDVSALLQAIRQQPAPPVPPPVPLRPTAATDLPAQLLAFRQVLEQAVQTPVSEPVLTALERAYQRVQAAHLLMGAHFHSVEQQLSAAALPATFEARRQATATRYARLFGPLLTPLATPMVQLHDTTDRAALVATSAFQEALQQAIQESLTRLLPHLQEPPRPLLRTQMLPVRPAQFAPRPLHLAPVIVPSYLQPEPHQVVPTPADLAETPETPFHADILAQAQALEYDYIRIYEFVRNEITLEWYAGAMKGALGTLRQKSGNAVDQASLLIALLRASSAPARYVHGVIRLPLEQVMASLGLTEATPATRALSAAGLAYRPVLQGGQIAAVDLESTWVAAYVPYTNYRGAVVDASGPLWLPLMPALKRVQVEPATQILRTMGSTADALLTDYLAQPQTTDLRTQLEEAVTTYLQAHGQTATYAQQLGAIQVVPSHLGLLPTTLPVSVTAVTAEAAALDDSLRQRLRFVARESVQDNAPTVLEYTVPVSEVASAQVTLSYLPATVDDQQVTNLYGGLDAVPAYLIKLRPQLNRHGRPLAVATGVLETGSPYRFEVHLLGPGGHEQSSQTLIAGAYHALGISAQGVTPLQHEATEPSATASLAAALLARVAHDYSAQWLQAEQELAGLLDVTVLRPWPAVTLVSNALRVETVLGQPHQLTWQGVTLDVAFHLHTPVARGTTTASEQAWLRLSALQGSTLEHHVFEHLFLVDSISADKGLQLARAQGMVVHRLDPLHAATILPSLHHPPDVVENITTWMGLGLTVEIPAEPLRYRAWQGSVWRVDDPTSGAAGYFIAGDLAGGATSVDPTAWALALVRDALAAPNTAPANHDPQSAASVTKLPQSDAQDGDVGASLARPLAVMVRDKKRRPVTGASVTFTVTAGGGCVQTCPTTTARVLTDALGMASVPLILGQKTSTNPVYVQRQPGDDHTTQTGVNLVDAFVEGAEGRRVSIDTPFTALAYPRPATRLALTSTGGPLLIPGIANGWLFVGAFDPYDNPVSNVLVTYTAPLVASDPPQCDQPPPYVPTRFLGARNRDACPFPLAPVAGECGSAPYSETTTSAGSLVNLIAARGTQFETVMMRADGLAPLHFTYILDFTTNSLCSAIERYRLVYFEHNHPSGSNLHGARVGTGSRVPVSLTLLYGSDQQGYTRAQAPGGVEAIPNGAAACVQPNPMRYTGQGTYETFVRTALTPGDNQVVAIVRAQNQAIIRVQVLPGVVGLRVRMTGVLAQDVPTELPPTLIYLDAANRSQYTTALQYTIEPTDYSALDETIDLFEDGVWLGYLPAMPRTSTGRALLPRGSFFDPQKTYTAQVVLNRGRTFEVRSKPFRLPLRPKLLANVPTHLQVLQDVDVVNARSCLKQTEFAFTLNEEALVSLVFAQRRAPQATSTLLDAQLFSPGAHQLPLFLPGVAPSASTSVYTLVPGEYAFALTAVTTQSPPPGPLPDAPDPAIEIPGCPSVQDPAEQSGLNPPSPPNQDAVLGKALVEYHTDRLPVSHTLVHDVDVATGTLTVSRTDLEVPGRGVPLALRRTYSSTSSAIPGPLGVGWHHNYEARLVQNACEEVLVSSDTGAVRFARDLHTGDWQALKGSHGTLRQSGDAFDFYSTNGTRYHFVPQELLGRPGYRLDFIADPNGNATKLGYDPTETTYVKLVTVEDPAGRTLTFTYTQQELDIAGVPNPVPVISSIAGSDGQTLAFTYDARGNLLQVAREGGARVETYSYTTDRTMVVDPTTLNAVLHGRLASVTDPNGYTTTYSNDDLIHSPVVRLFGPGASPNAPPRVIPVPSTAVTSLTAPARGTTQFQYDAIQHQTTVINGRGFATTYQLNSAGAVVTIQDPVDGTTTTAWLDTEPLPTQRTNARGISTAYTYDAHGNVLEETVDGLSTRFTYALLGDGTIKNRRTSQIDRRGQLTQFIYDPSGNLVQQIDATGGVTAHTYATNGDRLSTRDPNGNITRYAYDSYGNRTTVTDPLGGVTRLTWDTRSRPVTRTDALGRATTMVYDTLNRPVQRLDPLGQIHTWTYDPAGNLLAETDEAGRATVMAYDAANQLIQRTNALGDTQTFTYDVQGNKTRETNFRGHSTTFTYDAADRLVQRTAPLGRVTTWAYDPVGNVLREMDALGHVTAYTYDAFNRRLTSTDALGAVMRTGYDGNGNILTQTDANGQTTTMVYDARNRLVQRTDPLGAITIYAYDANGNQVAETDANQQRRTRDYDRLNRLLRHTDALGYVTTYEYDQVGNLTRDINARLHATVHEYDVLNRRSKTTDRARFVTTYDYDQVGNRTAEHLPNGNVLVSAYDALNRLLSRSDALGSLGSFQYDADGNRTVATDANGQVTQNTYDALNQLIQQDLPADRTRTFAYDLVGNNIAETDPHGASTTFGYDARNRLLTTTDSLGHHLTRTYDAVGNRLTETDPRGHTTTFSYDARNRLVQTTDALGQHTRFTYDPVGNKRTETDKRGTETVYRYDPENRLLTTTKAGVTRRTLEYDAVGNVAFETDANGNATAFIYDPRNLRIRESRPLAAVTDHAYDAMGDWLETRDPEGHTTRRTYDLRRRALTESNGANETTTYTYDGNGNRLSRRRPLGNPWTYTYDAANRLTAVTDPLSGTTTYTYDGNGNRLTQTDANGHTITLAYDALNRLVTRRYVDGAEMTYAYDAAGNRSTETDPNTQAVHYTYDALNRRIQTVYPAPVTPTGDDLQQITYAYDENSNLLQVIETYSGVTGTRLTTRTYDPLDRLLDTTDPGGQSVRSAYDAQGNRLTVTAPDGHLTSSTYDALNRMTSVTTPQGVTEYTYDRASRLLRTTYPTGTTATQQYDAANRVTHLAHSHHGAPVTTYTYTYDANGNRTAQRVTQDGLDEATTYTYDAADRLQAIAYPNVTTAYTYDAAGNRLTEHTARTTDGQVVADKTYIYNARQQVTTITDLQTTALPVTFTYDAVGNRTQQIIGPQTTTYAYDARHQLRQFTQNDTLMGDFQYDWQGLRVRKATPQETVRYVYDGLHPLLVTDDTGTPQSRYTYGAAGHLLTHEDTNGPQYALADSLGSVVALRQPDGSLQARYQYDAWGQYGVTTGHSTNRLGFTAHEYDGESGLYYAKARYYDPALGVFLTPDLMLGEPLEPLRQHPYLYALGNPALYIDPDGQIAILAGLRQLYERYQVGTRLEGLAYVGYGVLLGGGGTIEALAASPTALGSLPGLAGIVLGVDFGTTGLRQVITGVPQRSLVQQGIDAAGAAVGMTPAEIEGTEVMLGMALMQPGAGRLGSQRALRLAEGPLEEVATAEQQATQRLPGARNRVATVVQQEEITLAEVTENRAAIGTTLEAWPEPANTGFMPTRRQGPHLFDPVDFADEVAQIRQESAARHGLTEVSEGTMNMLQPPLGPESGVLEVDPRTLRWSQTTAGGRGRADLLRASMKKHGWAGEPIDVVQTADGLVTVDHTRAAVALELGIERIPVRIHLPEEPLPAEMLSRPWNRFGQTAQTWGEAVTLRGAGQSPAIGPTGSPIPPRLPQSGGD